MKPRIREIIKTILEMGIEDAFNERNELEDKGELEPEDNTQSAVKEMILDKQMEKIDQHYKFEDFEFE